MFELPSHPFQHITPSKELAYLSKESSTVEKRTIIAKGTASSATHFGMSEENVVAPGWDIPYSPPISPSQVGSQVVDLSLIYFGMPHAMPKAVVLSPFHSFKASSQKLRPDLTDESGMIVIVPLREIPRDYAKIEIAKYIERAGDRKVYVDC